MFVSNNHSTPEYKYCLCHVRACMQHKMQQFRHREKNHSQWISKYMLLNISAFSRWTLKHCVRTVLYTNICFHFAVAVAIAAVLTKSITITCTHHCMNMTANKRPQTMNYYVCILNSNLNELLPLHALAHLLTTCYWYLYECGHTTIQCLCASNSFGRNSFYICRCSASVNARFHIIILISSERKKHFKSAYSNQDIIECHLPTCCFSFKSKDLTWIIVTSKQIYATISSTINRIECSFVTDFFFLIALRFLRFSRIASLFAKLSFYSFLTLTLTLSCVVCQPPLVT